MTSSKLPEIMRHTFFARLFKMSNGWFAKRDQSQRLTYFVCASSKQKDRFKNNERVLLRYTGHGNFAEFIRRAPKTKLATA